MTDLKTPSLDALDTAIRAVGEAHYILESMQLPDPFTLIDKTGTVDVTDAIQKAIDQGIEIPTGLYLVEPNRLSAQRDVVMAADAFLETKPNALTRYYLLKMTAGTTLRGGRLMGDRGAHDYSGGPSSEWCCGLMLSGDGIKVYGTVCEQFPGDGLEANGANIELHNVVCTKNGRNGGSGFNIPGFRAYDCEFSYTGAMGTQPGAPNGPWAGFDCEPDKGAADDIQFIRCKYIKNASSGQLVWTRSGTGVSVSHVLLDSCLMDGNANAVETKGLAGPVGLSANFCALQGYKGAAFKVGAGSTVRYAGNTMRSALRTATTTTPGKWDVQLGAAVTLADGSTIPKGLAIDGGGNTYTGPIA